MPGKKDEESDVDLDYEKGVGWQFYSWFEELEKIFAKKTDVISNVTKPEHNSNWRLIETINKEKVLLYEKA